MGKEKDEVGLMATVCIPSAVVRRGKQQDGL